MAVHLLHRTLFVDGWPVLKNQNGCLTPFRLDEAPIFRGRTIFSYKGFEYSLRRITVMATPAGAPCGSFPYEVYIAQPHLPRSAG